MTATKINSLVEDAKAAGFTVTTDKSGVIWILKREKRWNKVTAGLYIYPDGTGFDATVELGIARCIRSDKLARKILEIN